MKSCRLVVRALQCFSAFLRAKTNVKIALGLSLVLSIMPAAVRATDVSGTIASNTQWTAAASPYVVVNHLTVAEGATLSIEPGVEVRVTQFSGIWVNGVLQAAGTQAQPIRFTGTQESAGWWRGLLVVEAGSALLDHCEVAHGGYWESVGLLKNGSGSLTVRNTIIRGSAVDGLRIGAGYSSFVSSGNSFQNNTRGVHLGIGTSFDDATSRFEGNGVDVLADGGTISGAVRWNLNSAYSILVGDHYTVAAGGSLTAAPGTVVKFSQFAGLWVSGTLEASGTAAQPVFFTEARDDAAGGDLNRDGNASAPGAAYWRGVLVEPGGSANLNYTTVRYSGYWDSIGVRKLGGGALAMSHATVSDCAGRGLYVENNSGPVALRNSSFRNCGSGLQLNNAGTVVAEGCAFAGNANYGVLQQVNDAIVYADNSFASNAWGSVGVNGGTLTTNANWTLGNGEQFEFVLRDHFTIADGARLTVSPGVTVRATQFTGMYVRGTLEAVGTGSMPVRFLGTTETAAWHRGILILDAGSARLEHCDLAHGGYWDSVGLLKSSSGYLILKRSTVRNSSLDGLRITAGSSSFVSESNTFRNNARGVHLGIGTGFDDSTARFESNGLHVLADGGTIGNDVLWNVPKDYAVMVGDHLTIGAAGRLAVAPGTVVKFPQFVGVWVNGRFEARGTATQPVHLTSARDDSAGGDTNGDGAETSPAPNWWRALQVENEGTASLTNTIIRYGGYWDSLNVRKSGSGALTMVHCTISDGGSRGLLVENNSGAVALSETAFQNNGSSGLQLNNAGPVAATGCSFQSNGNYGILQQVNDAVDYSANSFGQNAWGSVGVNNGTLTRNVTWTRGSGEAFDIVLRDHVTIAAGAALAVEPGINVRVAQFSGLFVQGALQARGTSALRVTFSGTAENPGWWRGIHVSETGTGFFEYCDLAYSGYWDSVGLAKSGSGSLTMRSTRIGYSSGDGLRIDGSTGAHEITNCAFGWNNNGVLARNLTAELVLAGSRFETNASHGVLNQSAVNVDARQSWWGDASGPRHPTLNPNGLGNAVSDRVLFEPWLSQAPTETGSLVVTIEPAEARQAGAAWSVDAAHWQESGAGLNVQAGEWTVQYKPIAGWLAPANRQASVVAGQTLSMTGVYNRQQSSTAVFLNGPVLNEARMAHNVATLIDGRIVLFGGHGPNFVSLGTAEVWTPGAESGATLTMQHTHDWPIFVKLSDGRYLLAGGSANLGIPQYAESEIYNPANNSFTAVGNMVRFRSGGGGAALSSGQVLIAGAWWTHNDAHTFGELWNPGTGQFGAVGALNQRRAYPLVLPGADGQAVVIGGVGPNGETIESNVELFNAAANGFTVLRPGLFAGETGWTVMTHPGAIDAQRMADGRYLLMAYRAVGGATTYALFTFDPATKAIERFATQPPLPDSSVLALWGPVVDAARGRAILLGQVAGASQTELRVATVSLASGGLSISANSHAPSPAYSLSGAGLSLLSDGRLFVTGGSEDGSNFRPVRRTLIIAPADAAPAVQVQIAKAGNGRVYLSWPAPSTGYVLERSAGLAAWNEVMDQPEEVEGRFRISWDAGGGVQFFRLRKD